jgi:3-(3-hydroxy-phenyl)propionate hydroxylase
VSFGGSARLGAPVPDVPMMRARGEQGHLLDALGGSFELLYVADGGRRPPPDGARMLVIGEDLIDSSGLFAERFDATPGSVYLLRPDQHLCARWRAYDRGKVAAARSRALGH